RALHPAAPALPRSCVVARLTPALRLKLAIPAQRAYHSFPGVLGAQAHRQAGGYLGDHMTRSRFSWLWLLLLCGSAGLAQAPTGAIAGTVYDPSAAIVSNASITITSAATGFERALQSNQAGRYSASSLAAGTYNIKVAAPGFRTLNTSAVV